jgi:hypothetical protein
MSYYGAPFVTAVALWDNHFSGEFCHGHVVKLYADGTVWECTGKQTREGVIIFTDGRVTQKLTFLKQEFKRDLEGMGRHWRAMYKAKDYDIVSRVLLERFHVEQSNKLPK